MTDTEKNKQNLHKSMNEYEDAYKTEIISDDEDEHIRAFISSIVQKRLELPLVETLKSGVILCEFVNKVLGNSVKNEKSIKKVDNFNLNLLSYKVSNSPFIQRENIDIFLKFAKQFVQSYELFETEDLFSKKSWNRVKVTLCALTRGLQFHGFIENCIGPQLLTDHEEFKKENSLRNLENRIFRPIYSFHEKQVDRTRKFWGRRQISVEMMNYKYKDYHDSANVFENENIGKDQNNDSCITKENKMNENK